MNLSAVLIVSAHTVGAYLGLIGFFLLAKDWPRNIFTITHWIVVAALFGLSFYLYKKWGGNLSAFAVTNIAMVTLFIIEFVVYNWLYKGELWFLNFLDFYVSFFIAASVVYFVSMK